MSDSARPIRILMVTPRFHPFIGGIETHVREVARRLTGPEATVTVLTTDPSGTLPPTELVDGVEIRRVRAHPAHRDYYLAPDLAKVVAERQWDLVHCQGCHTLVPPLAMAAALRAKLPYVITFHSGGSSSRLRGALRGAQWQALRPLLARATRLIGPSAWEVAHFQRQLRLPTARFSVIPNGAQRPVLPSAGARAEGDQPLIVSVGRLERYKGHQHVIAALPYVLMHVPDARLRIAGGGPYEAALRRLVRKLRLEDRVEIAEVRSGDVEGMSGLLARADVVTLLSDYESQGISVIDALALGRPVVVADATALHEFVARGEALGVRDWRSPTEVAAVILRQLRNPLVPLDVSLPTWDNCAANLLALYRTVVGEVVVSDEVAAAARG